MNIIPGPVFRKEICEKLSDQELAYMIETNKYYYDLCSDVLDRRKEERMEMINEDILFAKLDDVMKIYGGNFDESDIDYFFTLYSNYYRGILPNRDYYLIEKVGRSGSNEYYLGNINHADAVFEYLKRRGVLVSTFLFQIKKQLAHWEKGWIFSEPTLKTVIDEIRSTGDYTDRRLKFHLIAI